MNTFSYLSTIQTVRGSAQLYNFKRVYFFMIFYFYKYME